MMKNLLKWFKQYKRMQKVKKGFKMIKKNWKGIFQSMDMIKKAFFSKKK